MKTKIRNAIVGWLLIIGFLVGSYFLSSYFNSLFPDFPLPTDPIASNIVGMFLYPIGLIMVFALLALITDLAKIVGKAFIDKVGFLNKAVSINKNKPYKTAVAPSKLL